jgi:zinc protease
MIIFTLVFGINTLKENKMTKIFTFLMFISFLNSYSLSAFETNEIEKLKWGNVEVIWVKDNRFPTYTVSMYFADGALSDSPSLMGTTEAMFHLLKSGTRRFSHKNIVDNLEFYGASPSAYVTHEFSSYSVSGLVKDIIPTMKKICHLFNDATFPQQELEKETKRALVGLNNMVNNHGSLASRAFREISLRGTPYELPTGGKRSTIKRIRRQHLIEKLAYFNNKVKKRIYLAGPVGVLNIRNIITKDCGWSKTADFERSIDFKEQKALKKPRIVLVTVPNANQSQVRIGRFLNPSELKNKELMTLTSEYLGGGFTSLLMRELRVNRGLTYSVSAFAAGQKGYGRSGISTFTKNETLVELLKVTGETVRNVAKGKVPKVKLNRAIGALAGSYPFQFETSGRYLSELLYLDHIGRDYKELFEFPERVRALKASEVASGAELYFGWDKQTIVITGPKSLEKELKKEFGNVTVVDHKRYL